MFLSRYPLFLCWVDLSHRLSLEALWVRLRTLALLEMMINRSCRCGTCFCIQLGILCHVYLDSVSMGSDSYSGGTRRLIFNHHSDSLDFIFILYPQLLLIFMVMVTHMIFHFVQQINNNIQPFSSIIIK